jgi:predicted O-methyltransferase YrrM
MSDVEAAAYQAEVRTQSLPGWCTPDKARKLVELVVSDKVEKAVELGVFGGRSLLAIALGMQVNGRGRVDAVDPYTAAACIEGKNDPANDAWWSKLALNDIQGEAARGIASVNCSEYVHWVRARSLDVVDQYDPLSIDLLHQDSNHSEEVSVAEVRAWLPKLKPGGLWVFDDADWATLRVAHWLLRTEGRCEVIHDRTQWCVFRKPQLS